MSFCDSGRYLNDLKSQLCKKWVHLCENEAIHEVKQAVM